MMNTKVKTVDAYIASFTPPVQERLKTVRKIILEAAPEAEEKISYGMPGYKLAEKPLVYFSGCAEHLGLYALPVTNVVFKKELADYKTGKGSIQFPFNQALPLKLIKKIVDYRVQENLSKALKKK